MIDFDLESAPAWDERATREWQVQRMLADKLLCAECARLVAHPHPRPGLPVPSVWRETDECGLCRIRSWHDSAGPALPGAHPYGRWLVPIQRWVSAWVSHAWREEPGAERLCQELFESNAVECPHGRRTCRLVCGVELDYDRSCVREVPFVSVRDMPTTYFSGLDAARDRRFSWNWMTWSIDPYELVEVSSVELECAMPVLATLEATTSTDRPGWFRRRSRDLIGPSIEMIPPLEVHNVGEGISDLRLAVDPVRSGDLRVILRGRALFRGYWRPIAQKERLRILAGHGYDYPQVERPGPVSPVFVVDA